MALELQVFPKIVMTRTPCRTQEILSLKQEIWSPEKAVSLVSFIALLVLSNILLLLLWLRRRFSPREKNNELLTRTSGLATLLGTISLKMKEVGRTVDWQLLPP